VDLNLETLKSEILAYLETSDFAIFQSLAGGLEGLPVISWDTERSPDYRAFLETARKAGEKLILFASRELAEDELDEALEELVETEFTRDERRELESRLAKAQRHIGETCSGKPVRSNSPSATTRICMSTRPGPTGMRIFSMPAKR
jgi:hypothetical protein